LMRANIWYLFFLARDKQNNRQGKQLVHRV
jgi:hypothetical protein